MKKSKNLAIIILAAGTSSRLGKPKQLIKYKGESLLQIAVKKALKLSNNIFVVLGYEKEKCEEDIKDLNTKIVFNPNYIKGMGTSISCGIRYTRDFDNTLIMLCDQPLLTDEHFKSLKNFIDNKTIIASLYKDNQNPTVPAIFPKKYYEKLLILDEDKGAKEILREEEVKPILIDKKYSIDIDTKMDILEFLNL